MIRSVLSKISLQLFTYKIRKILQVRTEIRTNIFRRMYVDACEMYPENTLSENSDIASTVTQALLGLDSFNLNIDESSVDAVRQRASNDEWASQNIADYHRVTAYYFSYNDSYSLHSEHIEEAMRQAKEALASVEALSDLSFSNLVKSVKNDKSLLRKRIRASNKLKIEREKLEIMSPIKITSAHFSVSLTLISTLFIISGFVYTKSFFYWFGINVGDFYSVQDYLASSIDVISSTALSAFMGLLSLFYGLSRALNDELHDGQFDIQEKRRDYVLPFILITSSLGLASSVYFTGRWPSILVFPIVFTLLMYTYFKIPIWKFVENKAAVGTACLVIAFFFMHLGFRIKDNVENVLLDEYEPIYSIKLQSKYKQYSQMSYLTSNSNFVFLVDTQTKEVVVLPKNSVTSYKING
ncbi:hypothetical protein SHLO109777_11400 [Shewanella loihica]|uniref:Uncharacterized protein n=1 Tax=Shewanella loihica (strain ATCC BAA-1088 / PV-4) TaxID=323850 RepID=A3QCI0_SHELP|nr:hypothetical protein [Shewanella loihica]ABO23178.1 hypothetical protein Shew_1308 [Shewanella loihica PV-4]